MKMLSHLGEFSQTKSECPTIPLTAEYHISQEKKKRKQQKRKPSWITKVEENPRGIFLLN
jgi:hypothetical protein